MYHDKHYTRKIAKASLPVGYSSVNELALDIVARGHKPESSDTRRLKKSIELQRLKARLLDCIERPNGLKVDRATLDSLLEEIRDNGFWPARLCLTHFIDRLCQMGFCAKMHQTITRLTPLAYKSVKRNQLFRRFAKVMHVKHKKKYTQVSWICRCDRHDQIQRVMDALIHA